jgi:hypothetical protein
MRHDRAADRARVEQGDDGRASSSISPRTFSRTAVLAQRAAGGAGRSRAELRGRFGIPVVAYDSTAGGVSADGRTLVLIRPRARFPRTDTTFAVMSAKPLLRLRRIVRLPGDFSYDALSPDGNSLFLINYISPPTRRSTACVSTTSRATASTPTGRRSAREGRRDERLPRDPRLQRRRPLGLHALRRRGQAPVHPRARHARAQGGLHRPRRPGVRGGRHRLRPAARIWLRRRAAGRPPRARSSRRSRRRRSASAPARQRARRGRGQRSATRPVRACCGRRSAPRLVAGLLARRFTRRRARPPREQEIVAPEVTG